MDYKSHVALNKTLKSWNLFGRTLCCQMTWVELTSDHQKCQTLLYSLKRSYQTMTIWSNTLCHRFKALINNAQPLLKSLLHTSSIDLNLTEKTTFQMLKCALIMCQTSILLYYVQLVIQKCNQALTSNQNLSYLMLKLCWISKNLACLLSTRTYCTCIHSCKKFTTLTWMMRPVSWIEKRWLQERKWMAFKASGHIQTFVEPV